MYAALTCDSGMSGLFLAASHNACFVRFRNTASSSGMWLWSVERRTVGGSVKSLCARPGQPGTVHRQRCLAGYLRSLQKCKIFVEVQDICRSARYLQKCKIFAEVQDTCRSARHFHVSLLSTGKCSRSSFQKDRMLPAT